MQITFHTDICYINNEACTFHSHLNTNINTSIKPLQLINFQNIVQNGVTVQNIMIQNWGFNPPKLYGLYKNSIKAFMLVDSGDDHGKKKMHCPTAKII